MSEFSISSPDFEEGGEIPKRCGYKHGNMEPKINFDNFPENVIYLVLKTKVTSKKTMMLI